MLLTIWRDDAEFGWMLFIGNTGWLKRISVLEVL